MNEPTMEDEWRWARERRERYRDEQLRYTRVGRYASHQARQPSEPEDRAALEDLLADADMVARRQAGGADYSLMLDYLFRNGFEFKGKDVT